MDDIEQLWASLLSRSAPDILAAWHTLDAEEQSAVYAHLKCMVLEDGWAEPQRISAQAALDVLAPPAGDTGDPT